MRQSGGISQIYHTYEEDMHTIIISFAIVVTPFKGHQFTKLHFMPSLIIITPLNWKNFFCCIT